MCGRYDARAVQCCVLLGPPCHDTISFCHDDGIPSSTPAASLKDGMFFACTRRGHRECFCQPVVFQLEDVNFSSSSSDEDVVLQPAGDCQGGALAFAVACGLLVALKDVLTAPAASPMGTQALLVCSLCGITGAAWSGTWNIERQQYSTNNQSGPTLVVSAVLIKPGEETCAVVVLLYVWR